MDPTTAIALEPTLTEWPNLVPGDYAFGIVRLITLVHEKVSHLLFASVELLPTEMPVPPLPPNGGWSKSFGGDRLCVSRTALPWTDALVWYETLTTGQATVPGKTFPIAATALGAEPDYRGFAILADPPPFSPAWHGRPRLHRLIPMEDLPEPIRALRDGSVEIDAFIRAREWLRQHAHFDLLAYDDWLGSAVLIAPNPLLRSLRTRIVDRTAETEVLEIGGKPRRGADLSSLTMTLEEVRAGAPAWRADGAPDALGRFRALARSQVDAVRQELVCSVRGNLDREPPAMFVRKISVSSISSSELHARQVAPPRRNPAASSRTVVVRPPPPQFAAPTPTPLRQLEKLQLARSERQGALRPAEAPQVRRGVRLFEHDREETVAWIRGLITQARAQVLFVDPYLDADDLQEFATATEHQGVAIRGLINPRPRRQRHVDTSGEQFGNLMIEKIAALRDPAQEFGEIDIRVSKLRRLHDRFLQIDDMVWHSGHSFNSVGKGEISLMTLVAQPAETNQVLAEAFAEGEPFETYWANRPLPTWSLRQEAAYQLKRFAKWLERPRIPQDSEANDD
ncbi:VPA1262 family N-terminal domain-containing protein [Rhizobium sp. 11_C7_N12_5]|uniref:VPA1262 family N-terminal domain-containing protein n=1 Tax=Rhizobium sp. 11_C7_N12_5 TaxID=3240770 RepID=UPI003F266F09